MFPLISYHLSPKKTGFLTSQKMMGRMIGCFWRLIICTLKRLWKNQVFIFPFLCKLCFGISKSWWEKVLHRRISALEVEWQWGNHPLGTPSWNKGSKQWLSVAAKIIGQKVDVGILYGGIRLPPPEPSGPNPWKTDHQILGAFWTHHRKTQPCL